MSRPLRLRLTGNRTRYRNWLNRRAGERGKVPLPDRITRRFGALPGYRNRINPATGRPRRDDRAIGVVQDRAMASRRADREWSGPDAYRSRGAPDPVRAAANQQAVRDTLARRDPEYARVVERAARDVELETRHRSCSPPRAGRRSR